MFCLKEKSAEILYILTLLHFESTAAVQPHQQTFEGEVVKMDKTTCCLRLYIVHYSSMPSILQYITIASLLFLYSYTAGNIFILLHSMTT